MYSISECRREHFYRNVVQIKHDLWFLIHDNNTVNTHKRKQQMRQTDDGVKGVSGCPWCMFVLNCP